MLSIVKSLNKVQTKALGTLKKLRQDVSKTDSAVASLTARVTALETSSAAVPNVADELTAANHTLSNVRRELTALGTRCADDENRQRRSSLIFYGLPDNDGEAWAESGMLVLDTCSEHLALSVAPGSIKRAHTIGRFTRDKKRRVIVNFCSTNQNDPILGKAFAISEDFSPVIREARQELLQFAKLQNKQFKIKFNKLVILKQILFTIRKAKVL